MINRKVQDRNVFVLTGFGLVSFLGMNCLVAANGVMDIEAAKWLTFIRYSRPYIGILFIVFFVWLWEQGLNRKTLMKGAAWALCSLAVIVLYVGPRYEHTAHLSVSPVGWMRYFFFYIYWDNSPENYFLTITQIALFAGAIFYLLIRSGKIRTAWIAFMAYSLLHTVSENQWNLIRESERNWDLADGSIAFMGNYGDEIQVPLYFMQGTYSGRLRFGLFSYEMKFILNVEGLDDIDYTNAVLFSDRTDLYTSDAENLPDTCFEIGKYEYLYTSNMEIITMLEEEYGKVEFIQ